MNLPGTTGPTKSTGVPNGRSVSKNMHVFISSTCHDLIDLRAELESFFQKAGIVPVLSDSLTSEFLVMQDRNSIETCLANIRQCDSFLVILSNRYGPSLLKAGYNDISPTPLDYREPVLL